MSVFDTIAIGVGVVACAFDLRTGRIPNALTLGAALAALVVSTWTDGLAGTGSSALGWLVALLLWLPLYALGGMGAGDVKLIAAVGAWLGAADVIHAALYAAIAGGGLAVGLAFVRGRVRETFANVSLLLAHWRVAGFTPHPQLTLAATNSPRLAYAVPVLAGTVVAIWLR
jgi:prepilin peptidase CpaA